MPLMPNSSGVYANSVQGINRAMANQSALQPNVAGNFGTDPITGAPMLDKFAAQTKLAALANPNSLDSRYLASMQPTMLPGRAPSGPTGRMGPQDQRKIMNVGPRTSAEYTAKHGGLSPQRPSNLDAAYARGDFGYWNPDNDVQRETDPFRSDKPLDPAFAKAAATPMEQGGGYNLPLTQFDQPNEPTQLAMRAKGGPMKMGSKPYLVGEEGPELIMPRGNGEGFVLPADVTAQLLPTMRPTPRRNGGPMSYTPRAEGGIMTLNTPNARFAGGATLYGPAFAMTQTESQMGSPDLMNEQERELAQQMDQRMIVDNGYQVDLPALRAGGAQSIPLQPDVVTGPWASPAMPADTTGLQPYLQNQVSRLSMGGAKPVGRYPGQTFDDTSLKAILEYGNAMPGDTVEELEARTRQYQQGLRDPYAGSSGSGLTFEEMQQRMALRGMMYGDDYRDRQARNQTQLDLAARANRVPIGTPTAPVSQIPGMPTMSPSTLARVERNQERFLRSPEGAQFALNSAQRQAELQQRGQLASTAIAVRDPNTGEIMGYTTGTGASLPNMNRPRRVQRTEEIDGQFYNFFDDGTAEPIANVPRSPGKQTVIDRINGKLIELPPGVDPSQLPAESYTVLGPKATPEIGGAKTDTTNPAAPAGPVTVKTIEEARALKPGTKFTTPDGRTFTR